MSSQGPPPIQHYDISNFTFHNGDTLPKVRIAYQILNPRQEKIAVVHTCFRGRISSTLNHADYALRDYKVIVIALFGNGESSSPSNTDSFPAKLEYMDCIEAQHKLLTEELKIEQVDAQRPLPIKTMSVPAKGALVKLVTALELSPKSSKNGWLKAS